uniref:Probable C-mannosyltransferase DPY19L1 isoform X2 n=1 Tax=Petromyzon marinus TaxID=7757 RepID=A0AAJ7TWR2_PETMA|nr:probable C-mannosyltransferase DPY19L1 isoform X2 [Petromyzon marinus]
MEPLGSDAPAPPPLRRRSGKVRGAARAVAAKQGKPQQAVGPRGKRGRLAGHGRLALVAALAGAFGLVHWYHLSSLFENDRHFSHLSTLERELTFRTEMGLYYSYYKTIAEAPTFWSGLDMIMRDRLTEYPQVINTLKRFNLYPEVILGGMYRTYLAVTNSLGIQTVQCWTVNRGNMLSAISSCEGKATHASSHRLLPLWGSPSSLNAEFPTRSPQLLFTSGSVAGGLVAVLSFFFNHSEATRVMWTPPLRESFSYPFLVLQMLLVTRVLRKPQLEKLTLGMLAGATVCFVLCWQFAQFVLLTQVACLFAVYILGYIDAEKMKTFVLLNVLCLVVSCTLMFGNEMLLSSFYAASLVAIWVVVSLHSWLNRISRVDLLRWVAQAGMWLAVTFVIKTAWSRLLGVADDAHIFNILKSKLTGYKDFDTQMYTCAPEFDFMEYQTVHKYTATLLLPAVLVVFAIIVYKAIKDKLALLRSSPSPVLDRGLTSPPQMNKERLSPHHATVPKGAAAEPEQADSKSHHAELVFHALMLIVFAVMAVLIMRLKLFLTPHLCLMASLLCSKKTLGEPRRKWLAHGLALVTVALMSVQGTSNIHAQWANVGEFSNVEQEDLVTWIKSHTPEDAVFAGAMPTMASIKLSTGRAIVNHPHYEDAGLRARTKKVYSVYSRKGAAEVKGILQEMGVDYLVLEDSWCTRRTKPGCSLPEIWDLIDPENKGKTPLCSHLYNHPYPHFSPVFSNDVYTLLMVDTEIRAEKGST